MIGIKYPVIIKKSVTPSLPASVENILIRKISIFHASHNSLLSIGNVVAKLTSSGKFVAPTPTDTKCEYTTNKTANTLAKSMAYNLLFNLSLYIIF